MKEQVEYAFRRPFDPAKWGSNGTELDLHAIYVDAAVRQHEATALRARAPILEELATRADHKLYLAIAHRAQGLAHRLAGESDQAVSRFKRALELFQPLGTRWQIGRTLAEMAELERSRGQNECARDYFSRALVEFDEMRAVPDAAFTRARLASLEP